MKSFSFQNMFSSARTNIVEDNEATLSNTRLLLLSFKKTLLGDPYFGSNLKKFIYEQNNIVLQDLIIDDIYLCITTFIPQLYINRKDIKLISDGSTIRATINCINKIDNIPNMYEISLTE